MTKVVTNIKFDELPEQELKIYEDMIEIYMISDMGCDMQIDMAAKGSTKESMIKCIKELIEGGYMEFIIDDGYFKISPTDQGTKYIEERKKK